MCAPSHPAVKPCDSLQSSQRAPLPRTFHRHSSIILHYQSFVRQARGPCHHLKSINHPRLACQGTAIHLPMLAEDPIQAAGGGLHSMSVGFKQVAGRGVACMYPCFAAHLYVPNASGVMAHLRPHVDVAAGQGAGPMRESHAYSSQPKQRTALRDIRGTPTALPPRWPAAHS